MSFSLKNYNRYIRTVEELGYRVDIKGSKLLKFLLGEYLDYFFSANDIEKSDDIHIFIAPTISSLIRMSNTKNSIIFIFDADTSNTNAINLVKEIVNIAEKDYPEIYEQLSYKDIIIRFA